MYLVDTIVWLERLLDQERPTEVVQTLKVSETFRVSVRQSWLCVSPEYSCGVTDGGVIL